MRIDLIIKKIKRLESDYRVACESLAQDFLADAKRALEKGDCYASTASSSYIRDLPVLCREIQILKGLVIELQDEQKEGN